MPLSWMEELELAERIQKEAQVKLLDERRETPEEETQIPPPQK